MPSRCGQRGPDRRGFRPPPQRFSGYETSLRSVTEVAETLGAGDASAAWLVAIPRWPFASTGECA
jgi:hypothetical protein